MHTQGEGGEDARGSGYVALKRSTTTTKGRAICEEQVRERGRKRIDVKGKRSGIKINEKIKTMSHQSPDPPPLPPPEVEELPELLVVVLIPPSFPPPAVVEKEEAK